MTQITMMVWSTHLGTDILECEVKWALGGITKNKASGGDGISKASNSSVLSLLYGPALTFGPALTSIHDY